MSKWEMVRLGDVCEIVSGSTPSTSKSELWNGGVKWVTPAELSDSSYFVHDTERNISEKAGLRPMPVGTVLLSSRAPIGKVAIAAVPMCCNQGFKNLICSELIHNRYLYRWLKNQTVYLNDLGRGATFKEISKSIVEDIGIPLPPIGVQKKIADILDRATALIEKRKAQIAKLDLLVKSQFIQMFGDPVTNEQDFPFIPFHNYMERCVDIGSNGAIQVVVDNLNMKDTEDYALLVRTMNFTSNDFTDKVKYISKESYEFFKKSKVYGGEIIFNKIGSAGLNFIMPDLNRPVSLGLNQIMITPQNIDTLYLYYFLNTEYGKYQINSRVQGAVTKSIQKTELKKIPIMQPPIELQNCFSDFVQKVEKSKSEMRHRLDKLELLYKSLMQKCFNGDLIL